MPNIHQPSTRPERRTQSRARRRSTVGPETPWTAADADGQPFGRLTSNFPVWVVAGVLVVAGIAAAVGGSPWIGFAFAMVAVVVVIGASANLGGAVEHRLEAEPTASRQFAYPIVAFALMIAALLALGILVIVT